MGREYLPGRAEGESECFALLAIGNRPNKAETGTPGAGARQRRARQPESEGRVRGGLNSGAPVTLEHTTELLDSRKRGLVQGN
ncbi:hypothetical protein NDU88_007709 [Pleurodeles waltl]|uniref:Uncharacterized protein n=1 Tax=Pleurodeles waltl TaxID=8319 RepID=A0AAV7PM69_PLEWA|nr:hypothetical protein NDU88_007709 [Pleurodeles waltl]